MSRISTRKQALATAQAELARKSYIVRPVHHGKCTYLIAQKLGQTDRLYAVKGSSHPSGLVVTGNEHEQTGGFDRNLAEAAAHYQAQPWVLAVNTTTGAIGQQQQYAYRADVLAGERAYIAENPAKHTHCLYAHGPAAMQAVI